MSFPPKPPGFEHGVPRPPGFENVVHRPPGVPCSGCGCFVCGISHNLVFPVRINLVWCPLPTAQPTAQPTAHWPASHMNYKIMEDFTRVKSPMKNHGRFYSCKILHENSWKILLELKRPLTIKWLINCSLYFE